MPWEGRFHVYQCIYWHIKDLSFLLPEIVCVYLHVSLTVPHSSFKADDNSWPTVYEVEKYI